jgi:hypothetical protein
MEKVGRLNDGKMEESLRLSIVKADMSVMLMHLCPLPTCSWWRRNGREALLPV